MKSIPKVLLSVVLEYTVNIITGCTHGSVRTVGGSTTREGRVEVCISGLWGTVCDDSWSQVDANIVCWQLGYSNAGMHLSDLLWMINYLTAPPPSPPVLFHPSIKISYL